MPRFLSTVVLYLSLAIPALADPMGDLFSAALADDAARVEEILKAADSPKLQRNMMRMLGGSHPDLRDFTRAWAEAEPENAMALTAGAWSLYREAFLIRGVDSNQHSWPASLRQAWPMLRESFALAERALAADPTYLPASDAVNIIGEVSDNMARSNAEGIRILETTPNRHSLVISATSVRKDWLGRIGVKTDLCDTYAEKLPDAIGYTSEMCVIEAIYRSSNCCEDQLEWAYGQIGKYVDEPLMEETVLMAAARNHLAPEAADRLRARLIAEDRLTVDVALSGRPEIVYQPYEPGKDPLTDVEAVQAALQRDLAAAKVAADRDPGDPKTISRLAELYRLATTLELRAAGYYQIPPPDDIVEKHTVVMLRAREYDDDVKARTLKLIKALPRNRDALLFAATRLHDHLPDPLESALWRQGLYSNAVLYSNYRHFVLNDMVIGIKFDRSKLERKSAAGKAQTYDDAVLTKAFDCPYIRALRHLEAACKAADEDLILCFQQVGLSFEEEFSGPESVIRKAEARGVCEVERTAPIDSLRYEEIDLGL